MRDDPSDREDSPLAPADVLWAIGSLCNLHRHAFDAAAYARRTPPPHTLATLAEGLRESGFEVRVARCHVGSLGRMTLPCVVLLRAESDAGDDAEVALRARVANAVRPALVVSATPDRVVWFPSGARTPVEASPGAFATQATGVSMLVRRRAEAGEGDTADAPAGAFGFRTVLAELARHRGVVRDVLAASLALHLTALALPLASQTVIDKVIVNRATGTLAVVGVALALLIAFSAMLSWLRQYLVVHTGTRVDAALGSRVYAHLLRVPLGFFERRPVGVLVARMNGVETVREFLSGAAVTVALDVPFALVFVVVMAFYSVPLTLVTLVAVAALAVLSLAVAPPLQRRLNEQFLAGARTQALATEAVGGSETVKSRAREGGFARRYDEALATSLRAGFATRQLANGYQAVAGALEQALSAAILCAGAWLAMRGEEFTIGMLVAFQMFASRVSQPVLRLAGLWQQFQQAGIAVRRRGAMPRGSRSPAWASGTARVPGSCAGWTSTSRRANAS